jgi:hypothetical protein
LSKFLKESFITLAPGLAEPGESPPLRFDLPLDESDLFSRSEFAVSFWLRKPAPRPKKASHKCRVLSLGNSGEFPEAIFYIKTRDNDRIVSNCVAQISCRVT